MRENDERSIRLAIDNLKKDASESLFFLANRLLNYKDVNHHTHDEVIQALEADTERKLIVMPRGSLKSSLSCVGYPIWSVVRNPNIRILLDSELYSNSTTFLREIKQHLSSEIFQILFGNLKGPVWNESEIIVSTRTKTLKEATITCGGIGTVKVGQHYDLIIMDDLNSPNNSASKERAEDVINHYRYNLSILEPTGTMVIVGTRYSELDVIGHVLINELGIDPDQAHLLSGQRVSHTNKLEVQNASRTE